MEVILALLTVVVPLYNQEGYIKQCIDSIIYQTYKDIEILIINDGSTDNSRAVCEEIARQDRRVRIIDQENRGLSMARKAGVDNCRTEYITFVDADDFILEDSYIYAKEHMEKNIDMIFFEIARYYGEGNIKRENHILQPGYYDKERMRQQVLPRLVWDFERKVVGLECSLCVRVIKCELLRKIYSELNGKSFYYGEDSAITYPLHTRISDMEVVAQCYYMHRQREHGGIAPYLQSDNFIDEVYAHYKHMITSFGKYVDQYELRRQIEYFMIYSVEQKKIKYRDYEYTRQFLFPFDKVEKGRNIVLYGAGAVGKTYYQQLEKLHYCNCVLWVDKNWKIIGNDIVKSIDTINCFKYDYIIIAIENRNICEEIKQELISRNICCECVIY